MLTIKSYVGTMMSPFVSPASRLPRWLLAAVGVAAVGAIPLAALLAQGGGASSFTVLETGRGYGSLQEAVDAIGDREGTVIIAPGNWSECAVQSEGVVHFRAAEAGKALLGGQACEGKAALVLRGRGATVDGLVFGIRRRNAPVPAMMALGVARPTAHGQEMTSTVMEVSRAKPKTPRPVKM